MDEVYVPLNKLYILDLIALGFPAHTTFYIVWKYLNSHGITHVLAQLSSVLREEAPKEENTR